MNRFEKAAVNVAVPYRSRLKPLFLPGQSRDSYLTPSEAKAISSAMASAAPNNSLDNTQVDLNGARLVDLMERTHNNPRNPGIVKFLSSSSLFSNPYLADKTQLTGDSYYPASDKVVLPSGNPGALVRELGHAIDVNSFPNTPFRRLASSAYGHLAPDVLQDEMAWRKGRKALLEGGAKQKLNPALVTRALEDSARIKPYDTGSNWGLALGGLGGLGTGLALSHYASKHNWPMSIPTYMFPIAGGFGGAALGKALGYIYGSKDSHGSDEARKGYLDEYADAYSKEHNMSKSQARKILEDMTRARERESSGGINKAAEFGARMGKLAGDNACKAAMEFDEMTRDVPAEFKRDREQMGKWIRQTHDKKAAWLPHDYRAPALGGLGGALVGGLGGLGYGYLTGEDNDNMLMQALGGAGIGALGGAGLGYLHNKNQEDSALTKKDIDKFFGGKNKPNTNEKPEPVSLISGVTAPVASSVPAVPEPAVQQADQISATSGRRGLFGRLRR